MQLACLIPSFIKKGERSVCGVLHLCKSDKNDAKTWRCAMHRLSSFKLPLDAHGLSTCLSSSTPTGVSSLASTPHDFSPCQITASIALYATVSLGVVYYNWWLFTNVIRYPVFVSWIQQLVGFPLLLLLFAAGRRSSVLATSFPIVPFRFGLMKKILPLTVTFVGMVGFANICLKFVQVSTYQVARSLTLLFTVVFSYLLLGEVQSYQTMVACGLMVVGFMIGSLDTSTLSFLGVVTGSVSSVFQALYNVAIKGTLVHAGNNPNVLLLYNVALSSLFFIPVVYISGEWDAFEAVRGSTHYSWGMQCLALGMSGLLATTMNLASYWCVTMTSPLTFNIVGLTKSLLQSLGGIVVLGDAVSVQSISGLILSLTGSGAYSWLKVVRTGTNQWRSLDEKNARDTSKNQFFDTAEEAELGTVQHVTPCDVRPSRTSKRMQNTSGSSDDFNGMFVFLLFYFSLVQLQICLSNLHTLPASASSD